MESSAVKGAFDLRDADEFSRAMIVEEKNIVFVARSSMRTTAHLQADTAAAARSWVQEINRNSRLFGKGSCSDAFEDGEPVKYLTMHSSEENSVAAGCCVGQIGEGKWLSYTTSGDGHAIVDIHLRPDSAPSSANDLSLGDGAFLSVTTSGDNAAVLPPIVHLQAYPTKQEAASHTMVKGFCSDYLQIPATEVEGENACFLVLERRCSFSLCLIGGTGVGKSAVCNVLCGDRTFDENGFLVPPVVDEDSGSDGSDEDSESGSDRDDGNGDAEAKKKDNKCSQQPPLPTCVLLSRACTPCRHLADLLGTSVEMQCGACGREGERSQFTFTESDKTVSETSETVARIVPWVGQQVRDSWFILTDTPGLSDSRGIEHDEAQIANLVENVRRLCGVHVFLIVLDVQKVRWTQEQTEVMRVFDTMFSSKDTTFLHNAVFLFNKVNCFCLIIFPPKINSPS